MPTLEKIRPVTGAPCWANLMAQDLRAAQSFYTDVMGWKFRESILGSNFSAALAYGEPVAGIGCCLAGGPPAVWAPYFAVKNADETAVRIGERGATLAVGPLPLGEGRVGIAADRDGAVFGF
ncbi:VOC family protein [Streptomyces sp. NPDC002012]|uniref:VOC family protein n=1 Tax=unclassified Streptomyces TaxID=2593676 RepID=UPI00332ADC25